jgi:hypothetical protein
MLEGLEVETHTHKVTNSPAKLKFSQQLPLFKSLKKDQSASQISLTSQQFPEFSTRARNFLELLEARFTI